MKRIIGLGNPGKKYSQNRHNVGHLFIDSIARSRSLQNDKLLKTNCFMNDSGKFVKEALVKKGLSLKGESLTIAHDDLDIPLGQYKIQFGVGPKVHKGIQGIEGALETKDFWRIRIGVDNREPQNRIPGEDYVLQDFTKDERKVLEGVFEEIYAEIRSGSF